MPVHPISVKRGLSVNEDEYQTSSSIKRRKNTANQNQRSGHSTSAHNADERHVKWLLEEAQKRPEYVKFSCNRNQKLQNPERVVSWTFAATFSADYYKTACAETVSHT